MERRHVLGGGVLAALGAALPQSTASRQQQTRDDDQVTNAMTRTPDGRYAMSIMFTTLVLRPDQGENYIGFGYDGR